MKIGDLSSNMENDLIQEVCMEEDEALYMEHVEIMKISIRGSLFEVDLNSLKIAPQSRLYRLGEKWRSMREKSKSAWINSCNECFYLNQNPAIFHCLLDFYKSGSLHLPDGLCGHQLKTELSFWGLGEKVIAPCCLWKVREGVDTARKIAEMQAALDNNDRYIEKARSCWKTRVWSYMIFPFATRIGITVYCISTTLFALFNLIVVLESLPSLREPISSGHSNQEAVSNGSNQSMADYMATTQSVLPLRVIDLVLLCIITALTLLRFFVCPCKKTFCKHVSSLLLFVGVLSQWVPAVIMTFIPAYSRPSWVTMAIMYGIKVGRVVPMLSSLFAFRSMKMLHNALLESRRELILLMVLLVVNSSMFGYLVYLFEIEQTGTHFRSIPDGIWWGVVTMTTVGYGDIVPQCAMGRFAGIMCAIIGILVIALPVPIIAGNFGKIYELMEVAEYQRSISK